MHILATLIVAAVALTGCVTLPDVDPWLQFGGAQPREAGEFRRPLTNDQAAAAVARIERREGEMDILERQNALEEAVSGTPLTPGNDVALLHDGPNTYREMFDAIAKARDHVNLEFYTVEDDETGQRLAELLIRKRAEGVAINLVYDAVGSFKTPPEYFERLREGGINVLQFNPVNPLKAKSGWRLNNRDHRKMVIVDGAVGFTGGINISGVYSSASAAGSRPRGSGEEPGWRDTNVRVTGPAVAELQRLFLATWEKQRGEPLEQRNWFPGAKPQGKHPVRVIASSPDDSVPAIFVTFVSAIRHAARSVYLTMAYFAPDPQTLDALKGAAARGVDVKLILPSYTDFWGIFHAGRSHYSDLLEAGVAIYERQEALLHAKTAVVDGVWSTVGSSNIDWRSFLHNDEVNVVVLGSDFGRQMEAVFRKDLAASKRITPEEWERRPLKFRLMETAARIWEYWL
jgi:cardiolipin synthase A/B